MSAHQRALLDTETRPAIESLIQQIERQEWEPTPSEVELATSIIQDHLRKEARNREVPMLAPEDLCPAQKRDMIRDIAKLLRG